MTNPHIGALLRELRLPRPFSVNPMRTHDFTTGAKYGRWKERAHQLIMAQGPRVLIPGPVMVELIFPSETISQKADTDNMAKCNLDALVTMGLLSDDNRLVVPVILLRWQVERETVCRIHEFLGEVL